MTSQYQLYPVLCYDTSIPKVVSSVDDGFWTSGHYIHIPEYEEGEKDREETSTVFKSPRGFPGGAVVESLPANAGDAGSSPGLGRSHMPPSNSAREPQLLSLRVWSLCSATGEAAIVRGPRLPQLEKALAQKRRPNKAIHTYIHTYIKRM